MTRQPPSAGPAHPSPPGDLLACRALRCGTFLAPHLWWLYQALVDALGRRLGRPIELVEGTDYEQLGALDLAFVCGLPYVLWARVVEPLAAPVLAGARYGGRPIYFSDVVVRRASGLRTFADLRGRTWAYNEPYSQSGYGITRFHLAQLGETRGFFGRVIEAGRHEWALRLVAAGTVDATAIDSHVLATYLRQHPELAGCLRVIGALGPSPIQPVVAARHLPEALKAAIRAALLDLAGDPWTRPVLRRALVERFVAVDDATYEPIRTMLGVAAAADFLVLH